jgi:hypothetical protein
MTTGTHRLPRRRGDIELREDGARAWLVDPQTATTHGLNPTARAIWELCDGTTTVDELVRAIGEVFDVPPSSARADVEAIIAQLQGTGLVSGPGPDDGSG